MTGLDAILLVEDTRSDALLYAAVLRAAEPSRRVDHAGSLGEAMAMLEGGGYGAVFLDLGLPDSSDLDGLEKIVARHPDLAVVVLTGREDRGLGERAIAAGAQEYLRKDETKPEVMERVLRHARRRKALENRLRQAAAELHVLFDRNPLPVFVFEERSLGIRAANAAALEFYGWDHDRFLQMTALDIFPRHEHQQFRAALDGLAARFCDTEWTHLHSSGRRMQVQVNNEPIRFRGQDCRMAIVRDISREREAESARRRGDQRLATLADALPLLLMFVDRELRVEFINSGWTRELRRPAGEILGQPVVGLIREPAASHFASGLETALGGVAHNVEFEDPNEDGVRTWAATFIPQRGHTGDIEGIHVMLRDISLEKAHRQELVRRAQQDPLTGCLNRAGFQLHGGHAWAEAASVGQPVAVYFFDLDGFKEINDTLGHATGDAMLQSAAARVAACMRPDDLLARLGGDEFAVLARNVTDDAGARCLAGKLIEAVGGSGPGTPETSCSVGYCIADPARLTLSKALRRADEALYAAKRAGKGRAVKWQPRPVQEAAEDSAVSPAP